MVVWFNKDITPSMHKEDWDFEFKSKHVLGCMKDGTMKVVFAQRYEDKETVNWHTSDSEQWVVTNWITHWTRLPDPPTQ